MHLIIEKGFIHCDCGERIPLTEQTLYECSKRNYYYKIISSENCTMWQVNRLTIDDYLLEKEILERRKLYSKLHFNGLMNHD